MFDGVDEGSEAQDDDDVGDGAVKETLRFVRKGGSRSVNGN